MVDKKYAIKELQTWLRVLSHSIPEIEPVETDGFYGEETEKSVSEFQKIYKLPVTGRVDCDTWNKLYTCYKDAVKYTAEPHRIRAFTSDLNESKIIKGDRFSLIYILQVMLEAFSIVHDDNFDVDINGVYDDITEKAVNEFQKFANLPVRSYVDKVAWNKLIDLYNQYIQSESKYEI
jgi:peptidoglycan hydrolase-like protein with peptidoglycan-binding domain